MYLAIHKVLVVHCTKDKMLKPQVVNECTAYREIHTDTSITFPYNPPTGKVHACCKMLLESGIHILCK